MDEKLSFDLCDEKSKKNKEENQLKILQKWLEDNPSIKGPKNEVKLIQFINGCKYNINKTKYKIEGFYRLRSERKEWFLNRNPFLPEMQDLLRTGIFLPLKQLDKLNRFVFIIRTASHNPKKHSITDFLKLSIMIIDIVLWLYPTICNEGVVAIMDMKGVTLSHGLQITPTIAKRMVETWQYYPCKAKLFEFINAPSYVNIVLNTFRLFMSAKMKSRLIVRQSTSKVPVVLPKDIGGSGETYDELAKYWKKIVEENALVFEREDI